MRYKLEPADCRCEKSYDLLINLVGNGFLTLEGFTLEVTH